MTRSRDRLVAYGRRGLKQCVRARSGGIRSARSRRRSAPTCSISRRSRSARRSGVSIGFAPNSVSHSISRQRPCCCEHLGERRGPAPCGSANPGPRPAGSAGKAQAAARPQQRQRPAERAQRGALPRRRRRRSTASAPAPSRHNSLQLHLGQRGAERRHRAAEPGAVQRDHVHVAFGDDDPVAAGIAARRVRPRRRPAVEHAALLEDRRVRASSGISAGRRRAPGRRRR